MTLAGALHELRDRGVGVTLLAIGDAESEQAEELLRDPGISVALTGWTDDPIQYLAACDVLVLPTRREGYPNVVLEANACGVPVVTTTATGAVDSVVDGETGLLVPIDDARALADALEAIACDPDRRTRFAAAAYERAVSCFAPSRVWAGLDTIYRGVSSSEVERICR